MKASYAAAVAIVFLGCVTVAAAWAGDPVQEGVAAYQQKRYHAAEDLLNQAIAGDPTNQKAHLWLGRTLEMLLDPRAAKTEYENCYKINPFTPEGINARKLSLDVAGRVASDQAAPLDDAKTVKHTVQIINDQANDLKGRWMSWGNNGANWKSRQLQYSNQAPYGYYGGYGQNPIYGQYNPNAGGYNAGYGGGYNAGYGGGYNANRYVTAGYPGAGAGGYPNYGGGMGGGYNQAGGYGSPYGGYTAPNANYGNGNYGYTSPWGRYAVSNWNQIKTSYLRSDATVQSYNYRAAGTRAAANAQDSANNLERLLAEKKKPGEAKLRALGTDLYVRYYGSKVDDGNEASTPPEDPVQQLRATAQKLSDLAPSALNTGSQGMRATEQSLRLK